MCDVEAVPVVESGTLQFPVVDRKSHRTYDVESRTCGGTGPGYVSRVLRNFWLMQYDIYVFHVIMLLAAVKSCGRYAIIIPHSVG